jgi:hypothetical protein
MRRREFITLIGSVEHVVADDSATSLWQATRQDLIKMHADMQARWDQHVAATRVQV